MNKNFDLLMYYAVLYYLKYEDHPTAEWLLDDRRIFFDGIFSYDINKIKDVNGSKISSNRLLPLGDRQQLKNILENYREVVRGQILYSSKDEILSLLIENTSFFELQDELNDLYYQDCSKTLKMIEDDPLFLQIFSINHDLEKVDQAKLNKLKLFKQLVKEILRTSRLRSENDEIELPSEFFTYQRLIYSLIKDFSL